MTASEYEMRKEKLSALRKNGIDPYPAASCRTHTVSEALENFKKLSGEKITLAGRVRNIRAHGGSSFLRLEDESGAVQIYFKKDEMGGAQYADFENYLDVADFIEAAGTFFVTKTNEKTLLAENWKMLAKSLRPLPDKWYGLKDEEIKLRKRYLNFIMNPETREIFKIRAKVVNTMRDFLLKLGYTEVEAPVLQPIYGGGLAQPFKTHHNALGIPLYLRISTELYLKRMIVGGFERVFEFAKMFRNEGIDKSHNPEFTMLETMEAYADYKDAMKLVETMTEETVKKVKGTTQITYQGKEIDFKAPWRRLTMAEAVRLKTGVDFGKITDLEEARKAAGKLSVNLQDIHNSIGMTLAAVFEAKVEDDLIQPTIIYDFPKETSPLAKVHRSDPRYVERWEHYVAGMECSNNYSELNDPEELAERFKNERKKERLGDEEAHQTDSDFIEAVEHGMPPTAGIGQSIDRLVMLLTDSPAIRDVILFPILRPEQD